MNRTRISITSVGLAVLLAGCGSGTTAQSGSGGSSNGGSGGNSNGGSGGNSNGGSSGTANGGSGGNGSGGSANGGSGSNPSGGSGGKATGQGGSGGDGPGGSGGKAAGGTVGNPTGGSGGKAAGGTTTTGTGGVIGGTTGPGGSQAGGTPGSGGTTPPGSGGAGAPSTVLVTSVSGNYWKTGTWTEATTGSATVTVNDGTANQKWEGFGGAFNEMGWTAMSSADLQTQAVTLLFSPTDGANFTMGRIPIGASDYATNRYTDDDGTWTDVNASSGTRQPADTSMANFSIDRDKKNLIPYVKAAMAIKSDIRFWASPWTPPVWMKTGYKTDAANPPGGSAKKPSFFDGGNMSSDAATLTAYAQYYTKWVQGYKDQGINIEMVSPQNEPGYDQNYPSCLWDKATYTSWIGKYLGPAMKTLNVKVMLGTLSNADSGKDIDTANAAVADSTAKGFLSVVGVQWGVLDKVNGGTSFGGLPIWASEHKCGNYPWNPSGSPAYNNTQAPNDQAYGVESWGYIRDAITKGKVTSYSAWNMVLDKIGLGNDTSRDWKQDALLVADGGKINPTPAYYVFRHLSQYVQPGASVVGTTGGDAVAFKNPDNSLVAVVYNSGAENKNYIVKIGGKMLQFDMPGDSKGAWATIKYGP